MSITAPYAPQETLQKAHQPQSFTGGIASLADDRLYVLQNPFALDGRVSSYPASARGFSVVNSYLLTQPDAAMLIDTGFGKDEPVIRAQIESLIAPGLPLSLFPLRLNEFMSINNVASFAGRFNVETCYTSNIDAALWFDFGDAGGRDILKSMKVTAVGRADSIELGKLGRSIDVMNAPIRLIATRWLYDHATKTLFSSDLFTHLWRDTAGGPWIVSESDNDPTSPRDVRSFMLNTRYWWLEGAPTEFDPARHRRRVRQIRHRDHRARLRLHLARPQRGGAALSDARRVFESLRQERRGVALCHARRGTLTMLDKPQTKGMLDTPVAERMPREIAPGVFWIGDCLAQRHKGKVYHGYNAAFLVAGDDASILVETGHPKDFPVIERHLNALFARGVAPLKYLFVTHQETPHCGGLGRILKTFPDAILCGDVSDYHLAFPQYEHRMRWMKEGDEIELGGRSLMAVEPVIRDLRTTWWGFDTRERVLFPGDGFAYSHYHEDGHCGLVAEEAVSLDLPDVSSTFADLALFWTKFADMNVYCDRLDHLIARLHVKTIAPTHGLPITDVKTTVPKVQAGLKAAALMPETGTNEKVAVAAAAPAA